VWPRWRGPQTRTHWAPAYEPFSVSDAVMLLVGFAMFGAIYYGALYLQNIQGYSAFQAGLRTLPWTLMILLIAPIAGRVGARIGAACRPPSGCCSSGSG
jgi:hypothetical protein